MRHQFNNSIFGIIILCIVILATSCTNDKNIIFKNDNIVTVNREITNKTELNSGILSLNAQSGDGIAILKNVEFENGIISIDFKGEDLAGKSFVGVAFNIENDSTYEAVYFRPFNFESPKKINREHSIQYIYHPEFSWRKLRTEREGVFEAEFINPPNPNDWFSIELTISPTTVTVTDKSSEKVLMKVERLSKPISKSIGLWAGHNSKGSYRNLKIN